MIGRLNVNKGGGGDVVNGIIEQYLAETETIEANTFVEFMNRLTIKSDTVLNQNDYGYYIFVVEVSSEKVLILHSDKSVTALYGTLCILSENEITVCSTTLLKSITQSSYSRSSPFALNLVANEVLITYSNNNSVEAVICTISSENELTLGTSISIGSGNYISAIKYSEDKAFIIHSSSNGVYCTLCSITGNKITKGISTRLTSAYYYDIQSIQLSNNRIFISGIRFNSSNSIYYLKGIICLFSGEEISVLFEDNITNKALSSERIAPMIKLPNDRFFILFKTKDANDSIICSVGVGSISNDNAILDSITEVQYNDYSSAAASLSLLSKNKVLVARHYRNVELTIYKIFENNLMKTAIIKNSNSADRKSISIVSLPNNRQFIAYSGDNESIITLNGMISKSDNLVEKSSYIIEGITKTKATTTSPGEVWVLNN